MATPNAAIGGIPATTTPPVVGTQPATAAATPPVSGTPPATAAVPAAATPPKGGSPTAPAKATVAPVAATKAPIAPVAPAKSGKPAVPAKATVIPAKVPTATTPPTKIPSGKPAVPATATGTPVASPAVPVVGTTTITTNQPVTVRKARAPRTTTAATSTTTTAPGVVPAVTSTTLPATATSQPSQPAPATNNNAWSVGSAMFGLLLGLIICAFVALIAWACFQTGFIFRSVATTASPVVYQVVPPQVPLPIQTNIQPQQSPQATPLVTPPPNAKRELSDSEMDAKIAALKEAQRRFLAAEGGNTPPSARKVDTSEIGPCSSTVVNGNLFINNGIVNIKSEISECEPQTSVYRRKEKCSFKTETANIRTGRMIKVWKYWSPTPLADLEMFDTGGNGYFYNDQPAVYSSN